MESDSLTPDPRTLAPDSFSRFAQTADAVGATTKRLEKLAILAGYLSPLGDDDLAIACRFLSGHPFPSSDERTLNVGFSAVSSALLELSGAEPSTYGELVLRLGDPGDAAERILPPTPVEPGSPITLRSALDAFDQIASTRGSGQKGVLLRDLLAHALPRAGKYIVNVVLGELRLGLR